MPERILHLVSDSTGETVSKVIRSCLPQFETQPSHEYLWSFIQSKDEMAMVLQEVEKNKGIVVFTLVDSEMRDFMVEGCRKIGVPYISVLDPILNVLEQYFGRKKEFKAGRQHQLNADYFQRMEAVDFAISHDDGQGMGHLKRAQVILAGVSRMSKTPCCIYLAYRGIKAANVPIIPDMPLPQELVNAHSLTENRPLIVGFIQDAHQLQQIRQHRLTYLSADKAMSYANIAAIREEIAYSKRLFEEHGWPIIDVTRRSVEEITALIIQLLHKDRDVQELFF